MRTWSLLIWIPAIASADPDTGPPGLAQVDAPPPPALDELARAPAAQRGLIFESALTVPAGTVDVGVRAFPGGGVGDLAIGVTRDTELSAQIGVLGVAPTVSAGLERVVVHGERWRLAVEGNVRALFIPQPESRAVVPGSSGMSAGPAHTDLAGLGAVATVCVDDRCRVMATGGAQGLMVLATERFAPLGWLDLSIGSPRLRLLGSLVGVGDTGAAGHGGTAELVGVRAAWSTFAIEVAALNLPGDYAGASSTVLPYAGVVLRP